MLCVLTGIISIRQFQRLQQHVFVDIRKICIPFDKKVKIIDFFLFFPWKPMLWVLIRRASQRLFL